MSIELKENEWAKQMVISKSLGRKPSETLRRVARMYFDSGKSKQEVRRELENFLLLCDPKVSIPKWDHTLDIVIKSAQKYDAVDIDYILITEDEIKQIDNLDGRMIKRLAFTLLCLAKYHIEINPDCDYWVNEKDNEIMSMANISTSVKRQCQLYHQLSDLGMIRFSNKVDNTNVRVNFVDKDENAIIVLRISDFRNLGYQYLMYCGEPYFECENCGLTVKITDPSNKRRQKYCKNCAINIKVKQNVESVMRRRQKS